MRSSNFVSDEDHRGFMVAGDGFDRLTTVLLGQALEVEDFPFNDPADPIRSEPGANIGFEAGLDIGGGVDDPEGDLARADPAGVLPYDKGGDDQEDRNETDREVHSGGR